MAVSLIENLHRIDMSKIMKVVGAEIYQILNYQIRPNSGLPMYCLIVTNRWAMTQPEELKKMQISSLIMKIHSQMQLELKILQSQLAEMQMENGLTATEISIFNGITLAL